VLYKRVLHMPLEVLASGAAGLLGGTVMGIPLAVAVFSALIMLSRIGMWWVPSLIHTTFAAVPMQRNESTPCFSRFGVASVRCKYDTLC
jgi:hypothetical protein